jgi:hypothetical protein
MREFKLIFTLLFIVIIFSCNNSSKINPIFQIKVKCFSFDNSNIEIEKAKEKLSERLSISNNNFELKNLIGNEVLILFDKDIEIKKIKNLIENNGKISFWHTYSSRNVGDEIYLFSDSALSQILFPGFKDSINKIESLKPIEHEEETIYLTDEEVRNSTLKTTEEIEIEIFMKRNPLSYYLYPNKEILGDWNESSSLGYSKDTDTAIVNQYLLKLLLLDSFPYKEMKFMWETHSGFTTMDDEQLFNLYLIKKTKSGLPILDGEEIEIISKKIEKQVNQPMIYFKFTSVGSFLWEEMTEKSAHQKTGIAITFNNTVLSCPIAEERIFGGETNITGGTFYDSEGAKAVDKFVEILNISRSNYYYKIIEHQEFENAK